AESWRIPLQASGNRANSTAHRALSGRSPVLCRTGVSQFARLKPALRTADPIVVPVLAGSSGDSPYHEPRPAGGRARPVPGVRMTKPIGRSLSLSVARRLICDLMHCSRHVPLIPMERRMRLAEVAAARLTAHPRPSWCAIVLKAYSFVAAAR